MPRLGQWFGRFRANGRLHEPRQSSRSPCKCLALVVGSNKAGLLLLPNGSIGPLSGFSASIPANYGGYSPHLINTGYNFFNNCGAAFSCKPIPSEPFVIKNRGFIIHPVVRADTHHVIDIRALKEIICASEKHSSA